MDLDALLDQAAPPIAARTPALKQELVGLVAASEGQIRPRRRGLRIALIGGMSVVAVGATAAGTAALGPSAWTSWLSGDHQTCQLRLAVSPAGPDVGDGEPNKWPTHVDDVRRARMIADAKTFVADFDYAGIDRRRAVQTFQAEEAQTIADEKATEPASEVQARAAGEDLTADAITAWVVTRLKQHLSAEGYDMSTRPGSDLFLMSAVARSVCK